MSLFDSLTIRKMEYFIAVVESDNMSEAAEKVHVTQPLISKSIISLEETIGVPLFSHEKRGLILTEEGKFLYSQWKLALDTIEASCSKAREMHSSELTLRIGCDYHHSQWLPAFFRFGNSRRGLKIDITSNGTSELLVQLQNGTIDCAMMTKYDFQALSDCSCAILTTSPVYAYTSKAHPFSRIHKDKWAWEDLRNEKFMVLDPAIIEWPLSYLQNQARNAGFEPEISVYSKTMQEQFFALNNTTDFVVFIGAKELLNNPNILALRMPSENSLILAWKNPASEVIKDFAEYLTREIGESKYYEEP